MFPVLSIGPLNIQTYGLLLLIAFWGALGLAAKEAERLGIEGDHVWNLGLYSAFGGLVAARLGHAIVYWSAYRTNLLQLVSPTPGTLLLWPGLVVGMLVALAYAWHAQLPLARLADALATGILLGLAIGSLAALATGQAYGRPTDLPWAIQLWDARRHPTQIYEMVATLAVLAVVWWTRARRSRDGCGALLALAGYAAARLFLEAFRADSATLFAGVRAVQVYALIALLLALWGMSQLSNPKSQIPTESRTPTSSEQRATSATTPND
ncbi:MAG TPA: hypothetical protein EYP04_06860 [Anaerolineae bacterium]|nr:hypothetical protein [Anaerolineae bacterium]HIQ05405.1 hypothetical protein [Anaerolineae bacterium]